MEKTLILATNYYHGVPLEEFSISKNTKPKIDKTLNFQLIDESLYINKKKIELNSFAHMHYGSFYSFGKEIYNFIQIRDFLFENQSLIPNSWLNDMKESCWQIAFRNIVLEKDIYPYSIFYPSLSFLGGELKKDYLMYYGGK